jgi:putative hydrolases of HD superfamily
MADEKNSDAALLDFFCELGQLKRVRRSGWWTVGIKDCESVADHSFRCAMIGFALATEEGCDAYKTALICLCNDLHESRINDLHKVCQKYIDLRSAEESAHCEQIAHLPKTLKDQLHMLISELWKDESLEARIARDADILECMLQGREYYEFGYAQAKDFYEKKSSVLLYSETAKRLAERLKDTDPRKWLKDLVVINR